MMMTVTKSMIIFTSIGIIQYSLQALLFVRGKTFYPLKISLPHCTDNPSRFHNAPSSRLVTSPCMLTRNLLMVYLIYKEAKFI